MEKEGRIGEEEEEDVREKGRKDMRKEEGGG